MYDDRSNSKPVIIVDELVLSNDNNKPELPRIIVDTDDDDNDDSTNLDRSVYTAARK